MYLKIWLYGCLLFLALPLQAQTKSELLSEIEPTMSDFMAELSMLNEDKNGIDDNIRHVAENFGSSSYFFYNAKAMPSFESWIKDYVKKHLQGQVIEHTLEILDNTLRKKDKQMASDQRYVFDGILKRNTLEVTYQDVYTSWTVTWNGKGQSITILELNFIDEQTSKDFYQKIDKLKDKLGNLSEDDNIRFNQLVDIRKLHEEILAASGRYDIYYEEDKDYKKHI